jgi:phosphohistidine phosphatase SixA
MKLVLFRHGEREKGGDSNPPLSGRGIKQANKLAVLVQEGKLSSPHRLLCSPRLRTQMTFAAVAKEMAAPIQALSELDERQNSESAEQFQRRVKNFLLQQNQLPGVAYLCTHLDWLEAAMFEIPCDTDLSQDRYMSSWLPGHFMIFEVNGDLWHLEKMETLTP